MELVADIFLLYIVYKHQCNLFTMCSLINSLFTVTGNNNKMYSKNSIGNRNCRFKLPIIVFQMNSISLIEPEEFKETSIACIDSGLLSCFLPKRTFEINVKIQ